MAFTIFYVTFPNIEEAQNVCTVLLERRFIASVNYLSARSEHFWKGEMKDGNEIVAILKTSLKKAEHIEKEIKELHSYDIPCIMRWEVSANKDYEKWINEETK